MTTPPPEPKRISAEVPDWSREYKHWLTWDPGRSLLASIRAYQRLNGSKWLIVRWLRRVVVFRHRFWSAVAGADIPLNTQIAGGLLMPHPNGIVVHPQSRIGPNCLLFQQVTLAGVCVLEGHVDIGAGAKIIGPVTIGKHARIGANAVVIQDIPRDSTAAGVPARVIRQTDKTTEQQLSWLHR
ncbi:MAG: serine acetyltransferase [Alphaproteobacteria bacterium]|nr:serine acetyltransferase [Alphaproteobacteria bacterium]